MEEKQNYVLKVFVDKIYYDVPLKISRSNLKYHDSNSFA